MSSASRQRTAAVKVGVLTILGLALLAGVLIWLRGKGLAQGEHHDAYFDDVNGLREGAPVQMMGIRVGFVDEVIPRMISGTDPNTHASTQKYRVQVKFTVQKDLPIPLPRASRLSIEQSGLIGEQYLEVTPPRLKDVTLSLLKEPTTPLSEDLPVKMVYQDGEVTIGKVYSLRKIDENNAIRYRLLYRVERPGTELPEDAVYELARSAKYGDYLRIYPQDHQLAQMPEGAQFFTVENPLRMKKFLDIQMQSAEALKTTNDKLNQLMSDDTIATLKTTLKNTESLTARASKVMDSVNHLTQSTEQDLGRLVGVSEQLASNVSSVSKNVNTILGDTSLRTELNETATSFRESSDALKNLLSDPALKTSIKSAESASKDAAELMTSLRATWGNDQAQQRLVKVTSDLDLTLNQLNRLMTTLDESLDGKDENLKGTLEDTRETAKNLRKLTDKFSGHFTLFKLLF